MTTQQGKLIKGIGGFYYVLSGDTVYTIKAKKKLKHQGLTPKVGDNVLFMPGEGQQHGWLESIAPRKNDFIRPPVSNIDVLAIVLAGMPKPDYTLVDMLLLTAFKFGVQPIIVHNKVELEEEEGLKAYIQTQVPIFYVSALKAQGLAELTAFLQGQTVCLAGQSGVGKSTLINVLFGLNLETGDVSRIERGKHTTRHVEIFYHNGICLLDTPGFSALELFKDIEPNDIQNYYPEFRPFEPYCKFSPCLHIHEPECAVQKALNEGKLNKERMQRYINLVTIAKENWRKKYD